MNHQHVTKNLFRVGDKIQLQLNKEILQGPDGKKIKVLWYEPFEILEKVGDSSYKINLP